MHGLALRMLGSPGICGDATGTYSTAQDGPSIHIRGAKRPHAMKVSVTVWVF